MAWLGRLLASALLVLLGAGQALPGLHHALVQHVVCADHGELTHDDHEAAPAAERERADASESARPESNAEHHAHEHCAEPAITGNPSLAAAECRAVEFGSKRPLPAVAPRAERSQSSLDLLAFAPKLAPPV